MSASQRVRVRARTLHLSSTVRGLARRLHADERGQSLPLMLTAMGVVVIDVGLRYDEKRQAHIA